MSNYKYKDINLTPQVAQDLIVELCAGETLTRTEIADRVLDTHIERGGLEPNASDLERSVIGKSLRRLKVKNLVQNPVFSFWHIADDNGNFPNYIFKDIPLTSGIAKELLLELYTGKKFARSEAIQTISKTHIERGGLETTDGVNIKTCVKGALLDLKKNNYAKNVTTGYWHILPDADLSNIDDDDNMSDGNKTGYDDVDNIIGEGDGAVYLYYFPLYKQNAAARGESKFPCKIGMSESSAVDRVISQAKTALPETPRIALIIKTDKPAKLEKAIHHILSLREQKSTDAGSEWFITNPKEVQDIYNNLIQAH